MRWYGGCSVRLGPRCTRLPSVHAEDESMEQNRARLIHALFQFGDLPLHILDRCFKQESVVVYPDRYMDERGRAFWAEVETALEGLTEKETV